MEDVDTVLASNFGNEEIRKCASSPIAETFCQSLLDEKKFQKSPSETPNSLLAIISRGSILEFRGAILKSWGGILQDGYFVA